MDVFGRFEGWNKVGTMAGSMQNLQLLFTTMTAGRLSLTALATADEMENDEEENARPYNGADDAGRNGVRL